MATTLTSYADVQAYLTKILNDNDQQNDTVHSPHGDFWNKLTYTEFVTGNVPKIKDPITHLPMPILVKGDSTKSNIILALHGAINTPFDPNNGAFGQMPADGPPFFTNEQIKPIADWIDADCPN